MAQAQMLELAENGPKWPLNASHCRSRNRNLARKISLRNKFSPKDPSGSSKATRLESINGYTARVVGNGTEGWRVIVSNVLERMPERENMVQREQLKSPSVSRFVQLEKPGHLVFLEEPKQSLREHNGFWRLPCNRNDKGGVFGHRGQRNQWKYSSWVKSRTLRHS